MYVFRDTLKNFPLDVSGSVDGVGDVGGVEDGDDDLDPGRCLLCERLMPLTRHHVMPRSATVSALAWAYSIHSRSKFRAYPSPAECGGQRGFPSLNTPGPMLTRGREHRPAMQQQRARMPDPKDRPARLLLGQVAGAVYVL